LLMLSVVVTYSVSHCKMILILIKYTDQKTPWLNP